MLAQLQAQSRHHFLQQLPDFKSLAPDFYPGLRTGVLQTTFQRANDCPARLPLHKPGVPSVNARFSTHGYERRKPVADVPVRSFEVDERIVTAVHGCSHDPGRTEIYADLHRLTNSVLKQYLGQRPSWVPEKRTALLLLLLF